MKKLTLNLEEIRVESFDTKLERRGRGTVVGRSGFSGESGCADTHDLRCQAQTIGGDGGCGSSGDCDDLSVCWGGMC